ncbi:MAG TPA: secretin N-terminal domain-containing protein, partial [Candidatus Sumerlaeota bacterium]|nr:secretin N-terminal domain-containing protein [Candidatus Sumerlaeota bacterium]
TSPSLPHALVAPPLPLVSPKSAESLKSANSPKPETPPSNVVPSEASSQPTTNGLVTNVFMDSDIRQVLSDIATQTGKTIVADGSVQGMVSCELREVPLEKALRIVLSIGNFTWKQMDGFILVGSADADAPSFASFSETRLVRLRHIPASTAVSMLSASMQKYAKAAGGGGGTVSASRPSPERLFSNALNSGSSSTNTGGSFVTVGSSSNDSSVHVDPSANLVLLTAPPAILDRLEATLKQMDQPSRQVLLETRVVAMETGNVLDLGTQWKWPTLYGGAFSDSTNHGVSVPAGKWPWGLQIGYTPSKEFTNSLMVTLNLLSQNYDVTVKANPSVVALDGQEASIGVITDEYFEIVTQGFYTNSELQKIQAGTMLKITPQVGENGEISLNMSVEVSDVVARGSSNLPVVTRRVAQSAISVQDGGTAVVAGLQDDRSRNNGEHVSGVGRIPYLGRLFQNDSRSDSTRQVAVLVTARLVPAENRELTEPASRKICKPVDREAFRSELLNFLNTDAVAEADEMQAVPSSKSSEKGTK